MAVGSRGSFATVQPNTGVIDSAGMIKDAFADVETRQGEEFKREVKVQEERQGLKDLLADASTASTGQVTFDEIDYSIVSDLRDQQYQIAQDINNGRLSVTEGRAKVSQYNKKLAEYTEQRKMYTPNVESFVSMYSEGAISEGLGDDIDSDDGLLGSLFDGRIEDRKIDENGNALFKPKGDNRYYALKEINNLLSNPPRSFNVENDAKTLGKDFVSRVVETQGMDAEGKLNYYTTLIQKGISDQQKNLLFDKATAITSDPTYQNHLWYRMTGQKGKFDFSNEEVAQMRQHYYNKYENDVQAYMETELSEDKDFSSELRSSENRRKQEESMVKTGEIQPASVTKYDQASISLNQKVEGIEQVMDDANFAGAVEVPVLSDNATIPSVELATNGKLRRFNNVRIEGVAKAPNGLYMVRGSSLKSKGSTISSPTVTITEKLNDKLTEAEINKINSASKNTLEGVISDIVQSNPTVSTTEMRESIRLPEEEETFSALVPQSEVQRILSASGISEDSFTRQQSNTNDKPLFN